MEISEREQGMGSDEGNLRAPSPDYRALPAWVDPDDYLVEYKRAISELAKNDDRIKKIKSITAKTVSQAEDRRLESLREELWIEVRKKEMEHMVVMYRSDIGDHLVSVDGKRTPNRLRDQLREMRQAYADKLKIQRNPNHVSTHINKIRKQVMSELKPQAQQKALEILAERWRQEREKHEAKET